ncbi:MAG: hypothetical protein ACQEQC_04070 [Elusimicrobiota bacterium]
MVIVKNKIAEINRRLQKDTAFKTEEITDKKRLQEMERLLADAKSRYANNAKVKKIILENAYIAELRILSVKRKLYPGRRAYREGDIISDDGQIPVSLNELPFRNPPRGFAEGSEIKQMVPGSEYVVDCGKCRGKGRINEKKCSVCEGSGKTAVCVYYGTSYLPQTISAVFYPGNIPRKKIKKEIGRSVFDGIIYEEGNNIKKAWNELTEFDYAGGAIEELTDFLKKQFRREEATVIYRIGLKLWKFKLKKAEFYYKDKKREAWFKKDGRLIFINKPKFYRAKIFLTFLAVAAIIINIFMYISKAGYFKPQVSGRVASKATGALKKSNPPEENFEVPAPKKRSVPEKITKKSKKNKKDTKNDSAPDKTVESRKVYFTKAASQFKSKELERAYKNINRAIELNRELDGGTKIEPSAGELYLLKARILTSFENYEDAIVIYETALSHDPDNEVIGEELARVKRIESILEKYNEK